MRQSLQDIIIDKDNKWHPLLDKQGAALIGQATFKMQHFRLHATDNSCIERFWRSAKCERIYLNEYQSISELITDVMDVYQESIKLNQEKAKAS
jgi:hypothetical protein